MMGQGGKIVANDLGERKQDRDQDHGSKRHDGRQDHGVRRQDRSQYS